MLTPTSSPAMLRWARDRVGLDIDEAGKAAGVQPAQFLLWEEGDAQPTSKHAQVITRGLPRPFNRSLEGTKIGPLLDTMESHMAHSILATTTASISELKRNPMATVAAGEGLPVAILNRNEPTFYCVPASAYEALLERLENLELNALADARLAAGEAPVKVSLDDL